MLKDPIALSYLNMASNMCLSCLPESSYSDNSVFGGIRPLSAPRSDPAGCYNPHPLFANIDSPCLIETDAMANKEDKEKGPFQQDNTEEHIQHTSPNPVGWQDLFLSNCMQQPRSQLHQAHVRHQTNNNSPLLVNTAGIHIDEPPPIENGKLCRNITQPSSHDFHIANIILTSNLNPLSPPFELNSQDNNCTNLKKKYTLNPEAEEYIPKSMRKNTLPSPSVNDLNVSSILNSLSCFPSESMNNNNNATSTTFVAEMNALNKLKDEMSIVHCPTIDSNKDNLSPTAECLQKEPKYHKFEENNTPMMKSQLLNSLNCENENTVGDDVQDFRKSSTLRRQNGTCNLLYDCATIEMRMILKDSALFSPVVRDTKEEKTSLSTTTTTTPVSTSPIKEKKAVSFRSPKVEDMIIFEESASEEESEYDDDDSSVGCLSDLSLTFEEEEEETENDCVNNLDNCKKCKRTISESSGDSNDSFQIEFLDDEIDNGLSDEHAVTLSVVGKCLIDIIAAPESEEDTDNSSDEEDDNDYDDYNSEIFTVGLNDFWDIPGLLDVSKFCNDQCDLSQPQTTTYSATDEVDYCSMLLDLNDSWCTEVEKDCKVSTPSKVSFSDEVTFHTMDTWQQEYHEARISPWMEAARDRDRFTMRINRTREVIDRVLQPSHRKKMYSLIHSNGERAENIWPLI